MYKKMPTHLHPGDDVGMPWFHSSSAVFRRHSLPAVRGPDALYPKVFSAPAQGRSSKGYRRKFSSREPPSLCGENPFTFPLIARLFYLESFIPLKPSPVNSCRCFRIPLHPVRTLQGIPPAARRSSTPARPQAGQYGHRALW